MNLLHRKYTLKAKFFVIVGIYLIYNVRYLPTRLKVAWKYAELIPTTINSTHSMFIAGLQNLEYSWKRCISTGGNRKKSTLLIWKHTTVVLSLNLMSKQ